MKKFLSLIVLTILISSCQEDVKFNTPGFQGLKDDVFWRATDARAYIAPDGTLTIKAFTENEELDLMTNYPSVGTYLLGTTNPYNKAVYTFEDLNLHYETLAVPGPVFGLTVINSGTGYTSGSSIATNGGSGSGLTVTITANSSGQVTKVLVNSGGNGYVSGDTIFVNGGDGNCRIRVVNGGEIKITEYDDINETVSGTFKFNASNVNNNPAGGEILNYQYGTFYKVQIYPEL